MEGRSDDVTEDAAPRARAWRPWSALFCAALIGCGPAPIGDAGPPDAGARDAGAPDAGEVARDAACDGACDASEGELDAGPPCEGPARTELGTPPVGASWLFGGGAGYPDLVDPDGPCTTTVVRDLAALEAALSRARPGDVVYVADNARIDVGAASLSVREGVTLASGRGRSARAAGALLFTERFVHLDYGRSCGGVRPMIDVQGANVRITGLRIRGPDPTRCACTLTSPAPTPREDPCAPPDPGDCPCALATWGVRVERHSGLEIDNCEISGFGFVAVNVSATDAHVHHSHVHHQDRDGLGYGVSLSSRDETRVLIENVLFDANRHSVAGSGFPGQSYEARENLVLAPPVPLDPTNFGNRAVFDMHAEPSTGLWAGGELSIHHNRVHVTDVRWGAYIRAEPAIGAWVFSNCITTSRIVGGTDAGLYADVDRDGAPAPNVRASAFSECETPRLCASSGGVGPRELLAAVPEAIGALRVADLDGDGRDDVFRADGSTFSWLSSARGVWAPLVASSYPLEAVRLGDFDGDGAADAFIATGTLFRFSPGARAGWTDLREATERVGELGFADLDGDGRTDVVRADARGIWVSRGGTGPWEQRFDRASAITEVALADVDGDGGADLIAMGAAGWERSARGEAPFVALAPFTAVPLSEIRFADLDGDGRADALRADGARWLVAWSATGAWETLAHDGHPVDQLAFGDFDADGRADVLRARCF